MTFCRCEQCMDDSECATVGCPNPTRTSRSDLCSECEAALAAQDADDAAAEEGSNGLHGA